MKRISKSDKDSSDALNAVALQDHFIKSFNLNLSLSKPCGTAGRSVENKLRYRPPIGKAVVNSNRKNKAFSKGRSAEDDSEYVLDEKLPLPTLAQKRGLIDQPIPLLNESQWKTVKDKATKREEFCQPCVICKEELGKQAHVMLSCSHVFHKTCLQAFERFSGKKSCPMCRKEQYQTRVVHDGKALYKHKCAARIQASWRGYVVRCWYKKIRQTIPPKDPKLRRRFYEDKLTSITERMIRSMEVDVNHFLYDVDRNLEASRKVFELFDASQRVISPEQWLEIYRKASTRDSQECPICLTCMGCEEDQRLLALTSCSHMYHSTCLEMFEQLSQANNSSCPVCRANYQKHVVPAEQVALFSLKPL